MVKVRYTVESRRDRVIRRLNYALKGRLFKAAIIVFVVGLFMILASYQIQGTYYYHNDTSSQIALGNGQTGSMELPMLAGEPLNITFSNVPDGAAVNYAAYTIVTVQENGLPVVIKTLAFSGIATNNTVREVTSISTGQTFQMDLASNYTSQFNVSIAAVQIIPSKIPSNYYLGFPGAVLLVAGAIMLAVSITRATER